MCKTTQADHNESVKTQEKELDMKHKQNYIANGDESIKAQDKKVKSECFQKMFSVLKNKDKETDLKYKLSHRGNLNEKIKLSSRKKNYRCWKQIEFRKYIFENL